MMLTLLLVSMLTLRFNIQPVKAWTDSIEMFQLEELLGAFGWIIFLFILAVIVFIAYLSKMFWDRIGEGIQQSAVGNWYEERSLKWQASISIVSIVSLLFLFWCLAVYGVSILLGFINVSGIVYVSVLVSFPFFGYLVLGGCWSIAERLQREGLGKQTVQIGFPVIGFVILILLLMATYVAGMVKGTIFTGIAFGTMYFITLLLFLRAGGKLRMGLAELKDQLGKGGITQEEYKLKEKKLLESEKLSGGILKKAIFGMIVFTIALSYYLFPLVTLLMLVMAFLLFVGVTLYFGWKHPNLYVRLYAFFVAMPVAVIFGVFALINLVYVILAIIPFIPLWYLWHDGYVKEKDLFWWYRKYN